MGRVKDQSPPPLRHFTHPHDLHPLPLFHNPQTLCSGCKLQSSRTMYTCTPCAFTLHQSCATLPPLITHPCHVGCTLSLLAVSSYPGGIFSCNACTKRSDSWNYHCATCEYDLHVSCASKPIRIRHPSHASCELELTFKSPYGDSAGFSCDVCRKTGSKQWLYRCISCEFDVHLDCTLPVLRHQHSAPPAVAAPLATLYHNQSMHGQFPVQLHSASTGAIQYPNGQDRINAGQPYGSMGGNQQNNQGSGLGGNVMAAALQGFVEGAFQGVGQAVVQEVIGDGGGSSGVDGGGDGGGGDVYFY